MVSKVDGCGSGCQWQVVKVADDGGGDCLVMAIKRVVKNVTFTVNFKQMSYVNKILYKI